MDAKYYERRAAQKAAAQAPTFSAGFGAIVKYEDPANFAPIFTPSSCATSDEARYYEQRAMLRQRSTQSGVGALPPAAAPGLAQAVVGLLGR